jgi:hypothetical protein
MKHPLRLATVSAITLAVSLPLAAQGVTPTHTFETPMVFSPFSGQVIFATMIAPPVGENIWGTDLHISWTPSNDQAPELFGMELSTNSLESGSSGDWVLTGAGFGWSGGPGTYTADVSTAMFNGTLASGLPGFPATFNLNLDAVGFGGLWGAIGVDSKLVFHLGPRMQADVPSVSLAAGGTQTLDLSAGPTVGPGKLYFVLGSATGTSPFVIDGVNVPLQPDGYTNLSLTLANQGLFGNTLGVFGESGEATAQLTIPAGLSASLAGTVLHHSVLVIDTGAGSILSASNAVDLLLLP